MTSFKKKSANTTTCGFTGNEAAKTVTLKIREDEKKLLEAALKSMKNAYVLWGMKVGAAVLADDDEVYGGCNIESWISGLGICAERCAVNHAILHGNRRIKQVAVVMDGDKQEKTRPCGACLQYIHDHAKDPKTKIIMARAKEGRIVPETVEGRTLAELLPFPYRK